MNIIDLNKLVFDKPASELKKQVEALSHQNLKNIIETSKSSFAMPLTLHVASIVGLIKFADNKTISSNIKISPIINLDQITKDQKIHIFCLQRYYALINYRILIQNLAIFLV